MLDITFICLLLIIVFLVLIYFLKNRVKKLFDEIFLSTETQAHQYINNFHSISDNLRNEIVEINQNSIHRIKQNSRVIEDISKHLSKVMQQLRSIENYLEELDTRLLNRNEFEKEIIKLKQIIKRIEKKNVQ